ncbi:hypothetical protein [Cupriavidus pauculus]|uniref:hypothetical protein n=1 Tax=Cupriavidus pauculus TaxID=82633 RepID=UPI001EE2280D|nr:hypothetical protein [Cupriavidus pauculus]GJG97739.1 hypothetical protein CBA19C6_24640 [Cupriavidus pauculus]
MYLVHVGRQVTHISTLAGVLYHLNDPARIAAASGPEAVSVHHASGGFIPIARLASGSFALRLEGSTQRILTTIHDELERLIGGTGRRIDEPYEMRRSVWGAVMAAGRLADYPEEALDPHGSLDMMIWEVMLLDPSIEVVDFGAIAEQEFIKRFGYGPTGPVHTPGMPPSVRHEVHVAYALLRDDKVPEVVLDEYRKSPRLVPYDVEWMHTLMAIPALRGTLPGGQLQALCRVIRAEKLKVTDDNVMELVAVVERLQADATVVHVDDALFRAGFLSPKEVPNVRKPEDADATPSSDLAAKIHAEITGSRFRTRVKEATAARKSFEISQREFDYRACAAAADRSSYGFRWPNKVARAVQECDLQELLFIFDAPRNWNLGSKRALHSVLGVDLVNCTAAIRRRRIFEFCGMSVEDQERWEAQAAANRERMKRELSLEMACQRAEDTERRLPDGRLVNGCKYVDMCIEEGFSKIVEVRQGNAMSYRIQHPTRGVSRALHVKDGTLAYARKRLSERKSGSGS